MKDLILQLKRPIELGETIVHHEKIPSRAPVFAEPVQGLPPPVARVLADLGIDRLYSHQAEAVDHIRRDRHTALMTPTASGKSLAYNIPVFESMLDDPDSRALYVFPLKALEQDQLKIAREFAAGLGLEPERSAAIYDGDTSQHMRKKIRAAPPNILITNPDMLHLSILPYHHQWERFLAGLRYLVVDELHTYRGVFGSHIAQVIRRLMRLCGLYGSAPRIIVSSATVQNPEEFTRRLTGREFHIVSQSGAPQAERHFLFVNPATSPYTAASKLFRRLIEAGYKTIAFTKARKVTELMHTWVRDSAPELGPRISSYRSGFLPEERREIEQKLFSGQMDGVISTSALEMGVDIGGLDACVLVGYPGTVINTWQRSGRVGRSARPSLVAMVALPDALDQFFMRHPENFFARGFEAAVVDPMNQPILKDHLVCAAAELPLRSDDPEFPAAECAEAVESLTAEGRLLASSKGDEFFSARLRPQRLVDIRGIGVGYNIFDQDSRKPIGSVSGFRAFTECHEGAVYLHKARQHLVTRLDLEHQDIHARPVKVKYYTQSQVNKETAILDRLKTRPAGNFLARFGRIKVTEQVTGYEKKTIDGQVTISAHPLDLPPSAFETVGLWIEVENAIETMCRRRRLHYMGGLHAIEHAAIAVFPLFALCDRNDIGGICYPVHPQVGKGAIFIYDGYPGGVGLAERGFEVLEQLLETTCELVSGCDCEDGCPSCIHSPKCGSGNKPLDRKAAVFILETLLDRRNIEAGGGDEAEPDQIPVRAAEPEPEPVPEPDVIVFDIETQKLAQEVGGWDKAHLMRLSLAVVHKLGTDGFKTYFEKDVDALVERLAAADLVIGFNHVKFDYAVLSGYTDRDLAALPALDLLADLVSRIHTRRSLDHLALHTLKRKKSADGLQAVDWFRAGELDKLEEYCRQDVILTRDLFLFGAERGFVLFEGRGGKQLRAPVCWNLETILEEKTVERQK